MSTRRGIAVVIGTAACLCVGVSAADAGSFRDDGAAGIGAVTPPSDPVSTCSGPFLATTNGITDTSMAPIAEYLPAGSELVPGLVWATEDVVDDPELVWSQIAGHFAETGL